MIQGAGVMGVDHHRGHAAVFRRQGIPEGIHGVVGMDMEHVAGMLPQGRFQCGVFPELLDGSPGRDGFRVIHMAPQRPDFRVVCSLRLLGAEEIKLNLLPVDFPEQVHQEGFLTGPVHPGNIVQNIQHRLILGVSQPAHPSSGTEGRGGNDRHGYFPFPAEPHSGWRSSRRTPPWDTGRTPA